MKLKGFTLIELLISFTILVILVTGAAQLTIHSVFVKRRSDIAVRSAELASAKLEYLKALPFESEELAEGSSVDRFQDIPRSESYQRKWQIYEVSSNLKRIEIECNSESCPKKGVRLVLLYSREMGF
jgi:prepilin-type N-terminal cleavage/methylation domain-containing protein